MKNKSLFSHCIGTGTNLGLTIGLNADTNEYYCSSTHSYGFKVLLHNPHETPLIKNYGTLIPIKYETHMVITPTLSEAAQSIWKMNQQVRQCLFETESFLSFYR